MISSHAHEQSHSIRNNFRKQIRQKQIQQIFKRKRKLLSDSCNTEQNYCKKQNLFEMYEQIKTMNSLDVKLTHLGNYLYEEDCLKIVQEKYGKSMMQSLIIKIVSMIFNTIIPKHICKIGQQQEGIRNKCLTIVSNIMADALAPHSQLLLIISDGIAACYSNIRQTNCAQSIQVGWIIVNILCCKFDLSIQGQLQKPIEHVLTVAQQIIFVQDLQMLTRLYINLQLFFKNLDQFFHKKKQGYEQNKITQHYKIHRLSLLQSTVNENLKLCMGTTLLPIISFISSNLAYTSACSQELSLQICNKLFKILNGTSSQKIMLASLKIIKHFSKQKQIVIIIVKDYFQQLIKCLDFYGNKIKLQVIRLIGYLCTDYQLTIFIAQTKNIQALLCQVIKVLRDSQLILQIIVLTRIIIQQSNRQCGSQILAVICDELINRPGDVGMHATQIVKDYGEELLENSMMIR